MSVTRPRLGQGIAVARPLLGLVIAVPPALLDFHVGILITIVTHYSKVMSILVPISHPLQ